MANNRDGCWEIVVAGMRLVREIDLKPAEEEEEENPPNSTLSSLSQVNPPLKRAAGGAWYVRPIRLTTAELADFHLAADQGPDGTVWLVWQSFRNGNGRDDLDESVRCGILANLRNFLPLLLTAACGLFTIAISIPSQPL